MNTPKFDEFSRRLEQLIQDHIAECRRAAQVAVERAFAASIAVSPAAGGKGSPPRRERKPGRRRNSVELAALGDRLQEAVCVNPGETMAALALRLGMPTSALQLPMSNLKRLGKVRHVGARHLTRYFPLEVCAA
jgi:hypothetical protein